MHVGEDIAPVIVVLNEISLRKAHSKGLTGIDADAAHRH